MRKIILAILASAMIPAIAMAQGYPGGGPGGGQGMRGPGGGPGGGQGMRGPGGQGKMAQELGLTDEQIEKVRVIQVKIKKRLIDKRAVTQKAMIDLTEELQKENPDTAKVNTIIDNIVKVKSENEREKLKSLVEITAILTPEQKKKAAAKMVRSKMMGGKKGGPGMGGPGMRGPGGPMGNQ